MKTLLLTLGILALACTPAVAGRNANGAIIVHTNDAVIYSSGANYCGAQYNNPGTCANAGTRTDKSDEEAAVIWLIAAFLDTANPAVTAIQFGIDHNLPAGLGLFERFGPCGPGVLEVPEEGWPETGFGNLVAFSSAVTTRLFPFYYFAAYGSSGSYIGSGVYPPLEEAVFADDGNPPLEDSCYNFGRVRWNQTGYNNCPVPSLCQVTVLSPNGAEIWQQGTQRLITWTSSSCGGAVRIELLANGVPCQTIASEAPNNGSYPWVAQQCGGNTAGYRIRITDLASGALDESNQAFEIPSATCQIEVTAPNTQTNWGQGVEYDITWGSTACGNSLKIELLLNGSTCSTIANDTPNDGLYRWTAQRCGENSCGYKIRITDLGTGFADESNTTFCIRACTPRVRWPNGGESWEQGTEHEIAWTSSHCGSSVRIDLLRNDTVCSTIAETTPNDGSHIWNVQPCGSDLTGYKIRVTDVGSNRHDDSDGALTIIGCQITVLGPNGGERWTEGTQHDITWSSSHCGGSVRIELLRNGSTCSTITSSTSDDGSYSWTAENCDDAETNYTIRVTDLGTLAYDESDLVFSIPEPPCELSLTSPNGGESWYAGTPQEITWNSSHCSASVKIELLLNDSVCSTIAESTPNDGSYSWTAQRCGDSTVGYKIRVADPTLAVADTSDAAFSIPECRVTLTAPNGGENWDPGSEQEITWSSIDCGSAVSIELLLDGSACATIAASTPNDGSYPWTVQRCGGVASGYSVRIRDLATGVSDGSDETFCIGCGYGAYWFAPDLRFLAGQEYVEVLVYGSNSLAIRGYEFNLDFDPTVLECVDMSLEGTRGEGAASFQYQCGEGRASASATFAPSCPPQIEAGEGALLKLIVNVRPDAPVGQTYLDLVNRDASFNRLIACDGQLIDADLQDGTAQVIREFFRRGDDDASGRVDILDPISCLAYQFGEGPAPPCTDAADFDDSGRYDITDCITNLCYQFGDCPAPPPPSESCGPDPTWQDPLDCESFTPCTAAIPRPAETVPPDSAVAETVRLSPTWSANADTLAVAITITSEHELAGFQFAVDFDSSTMEFLDLVRSGLDLDFYGARHEHHGGRISVGGVPDLDLQSPMAPGPHRLGSLRFHLLDPARAHDSQIGVEDCRFVTRDRTMLSARGDRVSLTEKTSDTGRGLTLRLPNPFRPNSALSLDLDDGSPLRVVIYNVQGQKVRTLHEGDLESGHHEIGWDGRTEGGEDAATGIYYIRVIAGARALTRKTTLVR